MSPWLRRGALLALSLLPRLAAADLEAARRLLEAKGEDEVRRGVLTCAESGSAAAVTMLLEVLGRTSPEERKLPPGHYRDIAWEGLVQISKGAGRMRVEKELLDTDRPALVRQWCAELLGIYGEERFGESLASVLTEPEPDLVRWAARSLGLIRYRPAAAALEKLSSHKSRYVRANAIEALARIDAEKGLEPFIRAIARDGDAGVRCALLGAAREVCADRLETLSVAALKDKDWRPRLQAAENLAFVRSKDAVEALILGVGDARGIVATAALAGLQKLTRKKFQTQAEWKEWWTKEREAFDLPEGDPTDDVPRGKTIVVYHGINLVSDHAAFLLDRSRAMEESLMSAGASKQDAAVKELEQVLKKLKGTFFFNVFTYAETVSALSAKPLRLTSTNRKKALAFARAGESGKRKDIWRLLVTVVEDRDIDTAYLLSSGEPDIGTYVHWNRVTSQLRDLNRFHKVVFHTIAYSSSNWYRSQLEKIAQATGGEFQAFE